MNITLCTDAIELGAKAASMAADLINEAIHTKGYARMLVSTGASQFTMFEALIKQDVDWSKVEMFHLDEYIDLPQTHPASFVKYLRERFTSHVNLKAAHFVDTAVDIGELISHLTAELDRDVIDVGLIGIGENAHIAFNDPPADFDCTDAFKVVTLDQACRNQQFGEGWFPTIDDVPKQAVTMTPQRILTCEHIISVVPYKVKAQAIHDTLTAPEITNLVPATILRTHKDWRLFLDRESSSMLDLSC